MAVGVKDVAAAAGVSVGTVSNVLNRPERVSARTVDRVHHVMQELGFVRNDAARQLRAGHSRSIGLVVPDIGNPFFADVARGAEDRAADAGMTVLLGNSDEREERQQAHLERFQEQRVNGILLSPASDDIAAVLQFAAGAMPMILIDREVEQSLVPSVSVDDVEGGRMAAEHLIAAGRRRLAYVCGPLSVRQVADRLTGASAAVGTHPQVVLEVIEQSALTVFQGRAAGEAILARTAVDRPDAIIAANDLLAVGLLQAFSFGAGIRVPGEIAVVGYDDIDFASAAIVPLSSVRQPARLLGWTGVDLLLKELGGIEHERRVRFQPELIVRDSSSGAP
ncbi:LacI family DNA-binding transcriptional regulator [Microbacterium azadirachtae]|uniref:Transcriptional regulator, LacI family n=1 Tax=Microbacterium azadirachtae TaxID=582680 RepID=A0A1I6G598_9MICO|nr:LacI family DNA-binding transcriptional regulator [Microbacterium azadirachtae]SDL34659.1 transcriptional regulator, LacI family [Microbacterium azadirachtae]SEF65210.1 transcriptional regulator, LacI family [Microbacterium azadirachtae]SEF66050.1 transcriptional regulator, LacI family [Microbacterium azadirachtae]SFR37374.1 transcriptional regulator, LacI family [Microbacterium azadirachtae]